MLYVARFLLFGFISIRVPHIHSALSSFMVGQASHDDAIERNEQLMRTRLTHFLHEQTLLSTTLASEREDFTWCYSATYIHFHALARAHFIYNTSLLRPQESFLSTTADSHKLNFASNI